MGRNKTVSEPVRNLIIQRHRDGEAQIEIAKSLRLNKSVVSRIIKRFRSTGEVLARKSTGRPRKTSKRMDRQIQNLCKQQPFLSSFKICGQLAQFDELQVSARTIRRRLVEAGLFGRRPAKKPLLSKRNIKARLQFAQEHLHWTESDWKKVVFSDESKFNLYRSDGAQYVRRPRGKRLDKKYVATTVKHGGGSVMVWGCFSSYGMGPICRIYGNMDRFMYRDILRDNLVPYLDDVMPIRCQFQQDNDPKHSSKLVADWFKEEKIDVMRWPSQSPDLNPIENLWSHLDEAIKGHSFTNLNGLFAALETAWNNIEKARINKLIESMPKRCADVIKAKGYWTKY